MKQQKRFTAILPLPPSINKTYHAGITRDGKPLFYMDSEARRWKRTAGDLLLVAGWRCLPEGNYDLLLEYAIHCAGNRDIESISKILTDVATAAVGIDDRYVMALHIEKVIVPRRKEQRVEVAITVLPH